MKRDPSVLQPAAGTEGRERERVRDRERERPRSTRAGIARLWKVFFYTINTIQNTRTKHQMVQAPADTDRVTRRVKALSRLSRDRLHTQKARMAGWYFSASSLVPPAAKPVPPFCMKIMSLSLRFRVEFPLTSAFYMALAWASLGLCTNPRGNPQIMRKRTDMYITILNLRNMRFTSKDKGKVLFLQFTFFYGGTR